MQQNTKNQKVLSHSPRKDKTHHYSGDDIINCMKQSPSWETDSRLVGQEICMFYESRMFTESNPHTHLFMIDF